MLLLLLLLSLSSLCLVAFQLSTDVLLSSLLARGLCFILEFTIFALNNENSLSNRTIMLSWQHCSLLKNLPCIMSAISLINFNYIHRCI